MKYSIDPKVLKRRASRDKRFRTYAYTAILMAAAFLVFFFTDIITTALSAFKQAELLVEVHYVDEARKMGDYALDDDVSPLVSRGFTRLIPNQMREDRSLLGTAEEKWVLAEAEVDQYLKGKPNRLKKDERKIVDTMRAEGRARLAFNIGFFENGDSKLPEMAGIWAAAVGSMYVLIITFLFSFPTGVMTAIYLEEFAPNNRIMQVIEVNINNLAAIPSILFGLLGLSIFINFFGVPRSSALAGGLTLALMTLPVIIISTRAAIRAVPDSIREGSLALGATRWQMVLTNVLPLSLPGILTGTIIGLAQAIGETAPLLIVGMMAYIPDAPTSFTSAATVLPAQIYTWSSDSLRAFTERTSAGIIVLLAVMLSMNAVAIYLRNKYETKW
ncbi:MAG: phosphate ABC transporter permease PstA [Pseudodesulfovibrio sp.]|uniref:Phosphate transport system permease protein PstA n=1 Tax=Pseudodesulfovibrio aespoeensis (strain ATCC 700646 / DSM 10631 / Aspo-2) TaxID=643562 RepID=E6VT02_PSEA9|nr:MULTISPECIES: phosphate ABC transporter permease PstA [Pseudodesulfovibrio]MBU4243702.1 phosphate ABC transporter permease PstA [Pseudomonadota bacterium]ADU62052.1 phosphate ABC transporter, inner membrane subunit PstA [Pseudodesulfovibrio aespoeensis Aspo-2]MBU4378892.1 phosphate ABC transporter permease PstA [Pseudomonadota bacterium]MBU4474695.1 phosphate ABC transporter permease PstA [Pseudomonadota bacterium]MBU4515978.1 phosphate ABC transporter permease PstA [Pseudomonadota bacteriu